MKNLTAQLIAHLALFAGLAFAGPGKNVIEPVEPKTFCDHYGDVLDLATLYEGDGPLLQELKLIGRYHGQYHDVESDLGDSSDWENRRFRFGVAGQFLQDFEFEGQFNLKRDFSQSGRLFDDVEDLTVTWEPSDAWNLIAGKQKIRMSREWNTSSKRIKTMERSQLVNQIVPNKVGGLLLTLNDILGNKVSLGGFTGALSDDWSLPEFNAGYGLNASVARDITEATELRFDYFYNDGDRRNNGFENYENTFSLNSQSDWDRMHLVTDVLYGLGLDDTSDVFGVVLMPYFDLTDKLELVLRYTFSHAEDADGLNVQSRYERRAAGRLQGDEYHAGYIGLNCYICGDKLKLMNGIEYSSLDGADSNDFWSFITGVRMYF